MGLESKWILLVLAAFAGLTVLAMLGFFWLKGFDAHVVIGFILSLVLVCAILVVAGLKGLFGNQ
jgi:hypothetical protein